MQDERERGMERTVTHPTSIRGVQQHNPTLLDNLRAVCAHTHWGMARMRWRMTSIDWSTANALEYDTREYDIFF